MNEEQRNAPWREFDVSSPDDETFDQAMERIRRSIGAGYDPAIAEAVQLCASAGRSMPAEVVDAVADHAAKHVKPLSAARIRRLRREFARWHAIKVGRLIADAGNLDEGEKRQSVESLSGHVEAYFEQRLKERWQSDDPAVQAQLKLGSDELRKHFFKFEKLVASGQADLHFAAAGRPLREWRVKGQKR